MHRSILLLIPVLLVLASPRWAWSGKYNTVLDIGDPAPGWEELPGTDGESHSLAALEDAKAVLVVFTCNSCPYAVDVEDRLVSLQKQYADKGVAVVAINSNKVAADSMEAMKQRAEEKDFNFSYLWDESQEVGKSFGAKYTPEFFVLDGGRNVVYMGSMDDSPTGDDVTKTYVADAIDAVLSGGEVATRETVPIGCRIRYERDRRRGRSR